MSTKRIKQLKTLAKDLEKDAEFWNAQSDWEMVRVTENALKVTEGRLFELEPRYLHDCASCNYLGRVFHYDAYHCPREEDQGTIVLRYANAGPDYDSMPVHLLLAVEQKPKGKGQVAFAYALELLRDQQKEEK